MDIQELLESLRREFPGRNIVSLPPEDPEEIIVELDKTPEYSMAAAFIKRSKPHIHHRTTEQYDVVSGALTLFTPDGDHSLGPGDTYIIEPGTLHHAESGDGTFTRVLVTSEPPWSPDDHTLVQEPS